uniref:Ig-like domain-containing protein n=1 Tax=Xenopus tropicalis TaxID=8364 RepID=A0A803JB81_XENTR
MQIFIWFPFLLQAVQSYLVGPREVTGTLGGTVTIICLYSNISANIHGRKFWCKMSKRGCETVMSTSGYIAENHINRTHIEVMKDRFKVQIEQLGLEDFGHYRCGIGSNNNGFYHSVEVMISSANKVPSSSEFIFGTLLDSLTIYCPVPRTSYNHTKYWCKMGKNNCALMLDSDGFVHKDFWGRSIIQDNKNSSGYLVFMNNLQKTDSGFYRCGTGLYDEALDWKDIYIFLRSGKLRPKMPKSLNVFPGGTVSFECPHEEEFKESVVYYCKWSNTGCERLIDSSGFVEDEYNGRMHLNTNTTSKKTYTVLMTQLIAGDAGLYWCVISDGRKSKILTVVLNILETTTPFKPHTNSTQLPNIGPHSMHTTLQTSTIQETTIPFKSHTSSTQLPNIGTDIMHTNLQTSTIQETTIPLKSHTSSTQLPNIGTDIMHTTLQTSTIQETNSSLYSKTKGDKEYSTTSKLADSTGKETTIPFKIHTSSTQLPNSGPDIMHTTLQTSSIKGWQKTSSSFYSKTKGDKEYSTTSSKLANSTGKGTSLYPKTSHKTLYSPASPKQTSHFLLWNTTGQGFDVLSSTEQPANSRFSITSLSLTTSGLEVTKNSNSTSSQAFEPRNLLLILIPALVIGCILIMILLILIIIKIQRNYAAHIHSTNERTFAMVDNDIPEVEQVAESNELVTFVFKDYEDIAGETEI